MRNRISCFLVLSLLTALIPDPAPAYAAEQYLAELTPRYHRTESDTNFRETDTGVNGELFFAPISTGIIPYAEAAFLKRIGSAFFSAERVDITNNGLKGDGRSYGGGVNLAEPDASNVIGASYTETTIDYSGSGTGESKTIEYNFKIGHYFTPSVLAGVDYTRLKRDYDVTTFKSISSKTTVSISDKTTDYGLFVKSVPEQQDGGLGIQAAVDMIKLDTGQETLRNTKESLDVDYFFSRSLSAGAGIENNSGQDKSREGRTYKANIKVFLTPRISVRVEYARFENSNAGLPGDKTIDAALAMRF